ncbi:MAG: glucosamine-6-phosphate deaminase [Clostridia bacterium]|nr:glucosamine-6-phosphate deaminase [Oscillospiraceae bacterium]MBR6693962.1 glucosamine-6-phosphate deaminase [Clostridia bacterium]
MRIIHTENYEQLSRQAANIISAQIISKPNCVLGLATGSTPIGTYKELISRFENKDIDFSEVTTVNLDEYCGLTPDNDQSYRYFMNTNLFNHVNVDMAKTNVPSGIADDPQAECERYDNLIESLGGIDLQLLGIGHNGHIGFNEPDDKFTKETHIVKLGDSTIEANSRFFDSYDDVPKSAITMGIKAIMNAKKVLLVASGKDKQEILKKSLFGPITPNVPASILQLHPDLTVVECE